MLERLKEAERVVKNFNNTPDECRYCYNKAFKTLIHVTRIVSIILRKNGTVFYVTGNVVGKKDCIDSFTLNNDIKLVTLDEAMKEQSEYENNLSARYYKLKSELKDLEEELEEMKGRNK